MKVCNRNKQTLYYALYEDSTEIVDDYGNATGQVVKNYSDPVSIRMSISPAKGAADVEMFGINTVYNKTLLTDDMTCPFDESTILWIDREPTETNNYVVVAVAKSINMITYAIKKVNLDE